MKKNNKISWENLKENNNSYMPNDKFILAYNKTMRYIINKTNLQTAMFYFILLSHYNNKTNKCYPSLDILSEECGVSEKTIRNMIKELKEKNIIDYKSGTHGKCNNYIFLLESEESRNDL